MMTDLRPILIKREQLESEIDDLQAKFKRSCKKYINIEKKLLAKQQELRDFRDFEQTVKRNNQLEYSITHEQH